MSESGILRLLDVMARLRDPETGCPWDVAQTFSTVAPYTIEEAYEVADAIERNDLGDLREELGDLLLQIAFHSRMAEEGGSFDFNDVANTIADKMINRHPHVFADLDVVSTDELNQLWENQKAVERESRVAVDGPTSALAGVALNLPALTRAEKIQKRARRVGFDWEDTPPVVEKVREELAEVLEAMEQGNQDHMVEEVGDLLFGVVNLARHLQVDPETALRRATVKFTRRFQRMEHLAVDGGINLQGADLSQLDELWNRVKELES